MSAREKIAIILSITVCIAVLATIISEALRGPNSLPESLNIETGELLTYMLGMVSGWLLASKVSPDEPK